MGTDEQAQDGQQERDELGEWCDEVLSRPPTESEIRAQERRARSKRA